MSRLVISFLGCAFIAILGSACSDADDSQSPKYMYSWASVDSVNVLQRSENAVELELIGQLPSGCSEFSSAEVTFVEPDSLLVRLESRRPTRLDCTLATIVYSTSIDLVVPRPGTYGIRFHSLGRTRFEWEFAFE